MNDGAAAADGLNFDLPDEIRMLKDTVRKFVDRELIPIERTSRVGHKLKPEVRAHLRAKAQDLGLTGYDVPREYGGLGMGLVAKVTVWSELSRSIALPSRGVEIFGPNVSPILYHLNDEQKKKYLLPTIRGELNWCLAQTEPDAGGDPGGMRTTAVRDGDVYVINGVKRFISGANKADFMQLMAATDRAKGSHGGISCFLVDMKTPGVKLTTSYETMMGDRPWEIVLDNVRVPASHRVGEEGGGFSLAQKWLGAGRVKHGARALGVAERCLEMATSYAKQRSTFGRPLADRQGIQWKLADIFIELQAARLLVYKAATRLDKGEDAREDAYVCKYYADEMAFRAADQCMQIHGGIGLTTDLPIEKLWRQQRSYRITEGASEVMKMVIARHVLKAYG
jgi:acyl-CoA dehydrogenase